MGTDVECLLLVATFIGADDLAGVPRQPACGKPVCQDAGRIRNGLKNGGGIARPMLSCQIRLQRFGIHVRIVRKSQHGLIIPQVSNFDQTA